MEKEKIAKVNEFIKNRNNNKKDISDEEKILQEENDVDKLLMEIDDSEIIKANEEQNIGFTENYTNILQEINDKYNVKNDLEKINENEIKYDKNKDKLKFFKSGGLVVGIEPVYSFFSKFRKKNKKVIKEKIYYVKDKHCLTIGATGCGKTRSEVLQTIGNVGLAGESLIVSDPKLELYEYTNEFLKDLDYEVICIDFKNPKKSSKYNILQPIIEAYNENDIEKVQNYTEELANILTPESKGEKIWYNGEKSMTSGAILSCILHNKDHAEFQNMSNVYNFVAKAGGTTEIESPYGTTQSQPFIKQYCDNLPPESLEAKSFATVTQAGDKQRESYITSSLSSLRLFSTKSMWEITHKTDCNIFNAGENKIALFIGLPDEDTSYYPVASTIVCQIYNMLVKRADKIYGGTLPIRVNFILDEFGNFVKIPDINAKLTVARSRGIKFMLFLQSLSQLEEKYGKQGRDIIVANCQTWSYLLANDVETLDLVSKKLGKYTVGTGSSSKSGNNGNVNYSTSQNLTARSLLLPEELQLLKRPYNLILSENRPAMMKCPDISKISFNQMFAMGDQEHNNNLRLYVEENRPFNISKEKEEYWDAFKNYRQIEEVA